MKKSRAVLLLFLYLFVFGFTIRMQWIGMEDAKLRGMTNLSTLLMAVVAGILFFLLYRSGKKEAPPRKPHGELKLPSKEAYLEFAAEYGLTKRETEIGYLVLQGYSNAQLAEELFISETTVKKHLTHIYEKTGVVGRKELKEKIVAAGKGDVK